MTIVIDDISTKHLEWLAKEWYSTSENQRTPSEVVHLMIEKKYEDANPTPYPGCDI